MRVRGRKEGRRGKREEEGREKDMWERRAKEEESWYMEEEEIRKRKTEV